MWKSLFIIELANFTKKLNSFKGIFHGFEPNEQTKYFLEHL